MSPRIAALARFVIVLCVLTIPFAAYAQTCPQPVILTVPDICPGGTGSAAVEGTDFTTFQWSIVNGTLQDSGTASSTTFYANGAGDVELTVLATHNTSCQSSSTITIPLASIPPPVIDLYSPSVCPGPSPESMGGYAQVAPPPEGITYSNYEWSIAHGSIEYGQGSSSVSFTIDGSADAELTLMVTDTRGCQSSSTVTVPIRTIPPPVIDLYSPSVCPGPSPESMGGYAQVAPPPEGINYQWYEWSITNGTITWGQGTTAVSFTIDGSAPAELSLTVRDSYGCVASNSTTVDIRTIPPPVIDLYSPSVCPGPSPQSMGGYAQVAPPPQGINYQWYEWSIVNGAITYGQGTTGVSFTIDGSAPAVLSLTVRDSYGCIASNSTTVDIRTIPPPVIDLYSPSVCPGPSPQSMGGYAQVAPPPQGINYQWYEWSIVNGAITYGQGTTGVSFTIDGSAPAVLSLTVRDSYGCVSSNSTTVAIRTIPPPDIDLYQPDMCPGPTGNYASVVPPPAGINYQWYEWSIVNGAITYGQGTTGVSFTADGNGPVGLTLTVRDSYGCVSSRTLTIPLGAVPPITLQNPNNCSTFEMNRATIPSGYTSITWSVTGGTIDFGQGTNEIEFHGDGSGAISVSVAATNAEGCSGSNTVEIPVNVTPIPIYAPETACVGALMKVRAETVMGQNSFNWTITNATIEGPTDQYELRFRADGTGPVTASVTAREWLGCPTSNSVTIPLGPMPEFTIDSDYTEVCPGGSVNARISWEPGDVFGAYPWTVTNGYVSADYGSQIWLTHTPGTGDMTLTLTVGEGSCTQTASRTFAVRPAPEPILELASTSVCQNGTSTLYFDNASSFTGISVFASDASLLSSGPGRVPGGTAYTFRVNGSGTITHYVYADANSCTLARQLTATALPASATITASGPLTFCEGGSVTLTASAGNSYSWSNGATTQAITVTQGGNYTVTVVNANGCSAQASRFVSVRPLPGNTITASGPTTFCQGGSVTLTAPTGSTYSWSTGATTPSITVSSAGSYHVTVTSSFGCTRTTNPISVNVNPNPVAGINSTQVYDQGSGTVVRNGDLIEACGDPTVRLIPVALDPSHSYSWSTGATTAILDVTTSGTYTVTVTTAQGCSTSSSVTVSYGAIPPKPTIGTTGTELCPAGGSVTLTAPSADGYAWSNGATTQSIVVTEPGSYTVKITNGHCESIASDPVIVTVGESTITTTDALALCGPSASATLTANEGTSWLWSNGATTQSIVVTEPGTYSVTTTNDGCTMTESAPVTVTMRSVSIDASGPLAFCSGDSVTLTASEGTSWLWSNGATTQSITVTESGTYGVTASYGDGCEIAATPVVVEARQVVVTAVADRTTVCTNGAINLSASASGGAGYTYQWYDNTYAPIAGATSSTLTINPSTSGFVYVKVVDELGCGATSNSILYTVLPTPDATITTAAAICEGQTGSASVADAGAGATYAWTITNGTLNFPNASSVTFTPSGTDPVTLSVTITNAGCSVSSSRTVTINPLPVASITASGPTTFCEGGSVTLTASAGASYTWSNGATTQSITVSESGSYSVTVTSAAGCSATSPATNVTVNANPVASITASGPTTFCEGGSVTLTASAGASYSWSNGATTQSITVSESGSYSVTVTNAAGCSTASAATVVTVNANPVASITASGPTTFCEGGSVTLTASAGASYAWSNGATTQSITVSESGSYGVTVTNTNGCSTASSATVVTVNANPVASITASGPTTFCEGGNVTLTASAGASYAWSNGATTQSITVSESGSYSVTVTNAAGCSTASAATVVTVNANPVASISASGPTTFCEGGSVTLTASAGASYAWSNGATTQSITVSESGSYSVTVTNANGCSTASAATVVTVNANPVASITASGPTAFCEGGNVTLTASAGASYAWSNGATTQSITVSASGSYSVTVTNANGCSTASAATVVTVNATPAASISASGPTTFCEGGSVTLTASAGTSYAWSNGATTQSITVSASGSYSVTVTNANGCSATSAATNVTVNPLPTPSISASGPTTFCEGDSVTLTGQGGSGTWYRNGVAYSAYNSITINAVGSATFVYRITTAAGCSADSDPVTVTVHPKATINNTSGFASVCWNTSSAFHEINDAPAGATFVWTVTNGTLISGANDARVYYAPGAGATSVGLDVTMTNATGCSVSKHFDIPVDRETPTISASGPTTFCTGGSVTLSVPAAPAGHVIYWSNGAQTQSITVSSSGTYSAQYVKLAGSCWGPPSEPVTVTVNANPVASISASGPTTFCEGGSVTLTASAGDSYLWSNGATTPSISVSESGSYSVTVTNASGCSAISPATNVTVNALPAATISASGATTFCSGGSVTLTASAGSSYLWSNGATTQSINATASGDYSVTVTNANGCSATSSATTVTVNAAATPTITASGATEFCAGGSVTLTASAGASYLWSNGATTSSIDVNSSGSYSVTVTDANGCSATSAATVVTVNALPSATISASGATTFCTGGSVTLTASDGSSWLWSNGATSQSIDVTAGGDYSVTVTNANGCSATSSATTVTVNTPTTPMIAASGATTFCNGGSVTLTASAGASWLWSNGATTQSIDVIASGNYSVTVVDANGCSATSTATTVTVNNPATPTITASGATTFCQGGSVTLTASAGSSYLWSTGATSQSIDVIATGNYSVTVVDANGCSATSAATPVTVNENPTATISGPTSFCDGGSVTLTASAGSSWLWSNGATTQSIDVFASGVFTVTVTNASGCSTMSAPTTVTENANPATPTISASGPTTFCDGNSVTLSAPAGYSSYVWSNGATGPSINVDASGTFTVTVTNASGCSATSAATTVTENPATSIANQPQSQTIPKNTSATLSVTAAGTGPFTYQWYRGSSPSTANPISGANSSTYVTPKLNRGTYTYWVRVTGACGVVNSDTATVIAN